MKIFYSIIFSFIISTYFSQSACNNEDFETSPVGAISNSTSVAGWTVTSGSNLSTGGSCSHALCCTGNANAAAIINAGSGYIDPNIGASYPIYSIYGSVPNSGGSLGNNIIMVNDNTPNGGAQKISKSIVVTTSNYYFQFAFISVFSVGGGPSHNCCDAPSVSFRLLDPAGGNTVIPCPQYTATIPSASCTQTLTGLNYNICPSTPTMSYNKWKTVGFDLSPFIGTTVTFEAIANDCTIGGIHQAYMYFDAQCGPMGLILNGSTFYFPSAISTVTLPICGYAYAAVTAPPGFEPYAWFSTPLGFTYTPPSPTFTTQWTGTYTLTLSSWGSCPPIFKYGQVESQSGANVGVMSSNSIICSGSSATLTGNAANSYSWSTGSTNTTIVVSPTATTIYTLTGYNNYSCTATTTIGITVSTCTSIDEILLNENLLVYPQPANDRVELLFKNFSDETASIEIFDTSGKNIYSKKEFIKNNSITIYTENIPDGIYFLKINISTGQYTTKKLTITH